MAIDKNFVIKNGLEVNTNVLVAAADEKQVGIGTTRPYYKLHVGGGEGSRGGIGATDITISGIATLGVGNSSQGALKVVGISTFDGDVDLLGSAGVSTVLWDASENRLEFKDNASVGFGTGNDLTLWHDGSISYIKDTVGDLRIAGDKITLELEDGTDVKVIDQFGVNITGVTTTNRLYVSGIATVGTALSMADNVKAQFGTGGDLIVYHSGSHSFVENSTGNLYIRAKAGENSIVATPDGSVNITYDDNTRLETTPQGINVTGVTTTNRLLVSGVSTFSGALDVNSTVDFASDVVFNGANDITWDSTESAVVFNDGAAIRVGTGSDFSIMHDGNSTILRESGTGALKILSNSIELLGATSGETLLQTAENGSVHLYFDNNEKLTTTAIGATVFGDFIASGVGTFGKAYVTGIATFASDVNVQGNLNVTGDITYDEITGRNLNITGITTLIGQANFGTSGVGATVFANGNVAISGITTINGGVYVGTAASIHANGNLGITGILTAGKFIGIHTSADGGGIGIGSTTAHVGYGITYIDFKGPGVSTVYSSSVTGITTIYFQGGGSNTGAAGTWQNDGSQGISTAKSVGINTVGVAVTALMGGEKGASSGIGASMQGLYIGNGMMINDNQLNGNHYIGTAFGGIMAGPVTVNGVVTVDGNWAVV